MIRQMTFEPVYRRFWPPFIGHSSPESITDPFTSKDSRDDSLYASGKARQFLLEIMIPLFSPLLAINSDNDFFGARKTKLCNSIIG